MKNNQSFTITAGEYTQIVAPIYTDNTDASLEQDLASGVVEWTLKGVGAVSLVSKTSGAGITVDSPLEGWVTIEILEADTSELTNGDYYHIAEFTRSSKKRGLFDGIATVVNVV